jgi:hypothetical protein
MVRRGHKRDQRSVERPQRCCYPHLGAHQVARSSCPTRSGDRVTVGSWHSQAALELWLEGSAKHSSPNAAEVEVTDADHRVTRFDMLQGGDDHRDAPGLGLSRAGGTRGPVTGPQLKRLWAPLGLKSLL